MATGEITLRDLIAWTDLVSPDGPSTHDGADDPLDRDVDWVITARSAPPMLPTLRGGELVLLPDRVVTESALNLHMLIQELTSQPVAGVVLDTDEPVQSPVPVLRARKIGADLESDLNRMLTIRRGDLLRTGTDIERIVTAHVSAHDSPETLLRVLADHLNLEFVVRTARGNTIIATTDDLSSLDSPTESCWLSRPLRRNRVLMVGRLTPETHALGRLVLDRVVAAVQAALDEEASSVQDLETRTRLINQALTIAPIDPQGASGMLRRAGVSQDAPFRVAIAPPGSRESDIWPLLTALGTPIDAGMHAEGPVWLLTSESPGTRPETRIADAWIVVSGRVSTAAELAAAMRQVVFLMGARRAQAIGGSIVRFDDMAKLGVMRLLYESWGTPLLDEFVETMIGDLIREDRRGQLRETLRHYLAFGGTQRPTAEHLNIHRNTLTYRLRQIRALLAVDPDDPDARLNLHAALVAADLPPARHAE
ncbi:MAG TPA: helix-turn-helix domain-containing protein [Thermomicrobiales bacterium]|nr:helix-turn-helix domain-containing protein [Thermomicrobiales bacterium]